MVARLLEVSPKLGQSRPVRRAELILSPKVVAVPSSMLIFRNGPADLRGMGWSARFIVGDKVTATRQMTGCLTL